MTDHALSNRLPKPVMVAYGWPPERYANGVVSYTAEVAAGMRRLGARPRIALFELDAGGSEDFVSQVPAWYARRERGARFAVAALMKLCPHFAESRLQSTALLQEVRRLVREAGVDICEIEEAQGWAWRLTSRSPVPVVVRLHGPWFLNGTALGVKRDRSYWRRVRAEGKSIAAAHGVTAPSRSVLEAVRSYYGLPLERAEVIPNPVSAPAGQKWDVRACEPDRILFVGRFDRHKGGDVMIDALARLRRDRPGCRLTFAGPDTGVVDENGDRTCLKEYIAARWAGALEDGGVEWPGFQPPERLADLRRRAMVTVICSRYETFGIAGAEAMALGCPVIGTQVGGIPEIIQHERNGLLCRPGDADDLAEKVLVLLRNPRLAAQLGAQAAIDVETRYDPVVIARQTLEYYGRVISAFR